jgi:hypothetical protein
LIINRTEKGSKKIDLRRGSLMPYLGLNSLFLRDFHIIFNYFYKATQGFLLDK